jgi:hypothetical protein
MKWGHVLAETCQNSQEGPCDNYTANRVMEAEDYDWCFILIEQENSSRR